MVYNLFYYSANGQAYTAYQMLALFGIDTTTTPVSTLNRRGFYPVNETTPDFDNYLYTASPVYTIAGSYADQTWVYTPRPLDQAKENGSWQEKQKANDAENLIVVDSGFSTDVLAGVASQDPLARPARYQDVLDGMVAVSDNLDANLTAIDAASSVDEINNIVNPPTGVIHIGRTGEDLDPSYYVSFSSVSLTEADTELYIPGTSTVVVYGFYVPGEFDTPPGAFNVGDYLIQIREVATSRVIAEFVCPEGYEDISF